MTGAIGRLGKGAILGAGVGALCGVGYIAHAFLLGAGTQAGQQLIYAIVYTLGIAALFIVGVGAALGALAGTAVAAALRPSSAIVLAVVVVVGFFAFRRCQTENAAREAAWDAAFTRDDPVLFRRHFTLEVIHDRSARGNALRRAVEQDKPRLTCHFLSEMGPARLAPYLRIDGSEHLMKSAMNRRAFRVIPLIAAVAPLEMESTAPRGSSKAPPERWSFLVDATRLRMYDVAKALYEAGADPHFALHGKSALDFLKMAGHTELVAYLSNPAHRMREKGLKERCARYRR